MPDSIKVFVKPDSVSSNLFSCHQGLRHDIDLGKKVM